MEWTVMLQPGARGFWPNQSPRGPVPDTIIAGSNCIPVGPGKVSSYEGYGAASALLGAATMMPVAATSGGLTSGNIVYSRGDTYWRCGSGTAVVGSTTLGATTSALQFRIGLGGADITAGIATPGAPVLATNGAGSMTGTYSVRVAWKRSTTGAVGNASTPSAVVSASSNKLQLTLPAVPAGIDTVIVYASARGFGATGPWLFLSEHPVTPNPIVALGPNGNGQWADGERAAEFAPFDNDPPPSGTHCCALGNLMVVLGCYGGAGIAWSKPAELEAFPPDNVAFLPGPVIGVLPRPSDGFAYAFGANYLAALVLIPGPIVLPRLMWAYTGFLNADNACLVESELWGYTDEPVRTTQETAPDTSFGLAVRRYMRANWSPANVVVGYSPRDNAVVYFHQGEALAYYRSLDAWSTSIPGSTARAAVTVSQQLYMAPSSGNLVGYGAGSGTTATALTPFYEPAGGFTNTISNIRTGLSGAATIAVMTNLDQTTVQATQTSSGSGDNYTSWLRTNLKNSTSVALRYTFTGSVYESQVDGKTRKAHIT